MKKKGILNKIPPVAPTCSSLKSKTFDQEIPTTEEEKLVEHMIE